MGGGAKDEPTGALDRLYLLKKELKSQHSSASSFFCKSWYNDCL
jgi:hypothetical protein